MAARRRSELPRPGFDPEDCTFGSCELLLEDFTDAIAREPRTRELIQWATGMGLVACGAGLWLLSGPRDLAGILLLGLGLSFFAAHQAPEHVARRWFARTPRAARRLRYTLNSRELIVSSDLSQHAYAWPALLGYHETSGAFLIWVSTRLFLIVPKRAFGEAELARVACRLRENELGGPPPTARFWLWILLAAGLGALALLLWNRLAPR